MTLFSNPADQYSHRVRLVLAEKGVAVEIIDCDARTMPPELLEVNPSSSLPTLLDRELVLYQSSVVMEYLDERFPHPPLLPVYPVARATSRLMMHRIDNEWASRLDLLASGKAREAQATRARMELQESLQEAAEGFTDKGYFLGADEFSLVDCCVAPLLWRLQSVGIDLPDRPARSLKRYMQRLFDRDSFRASLSEIELEMRP